MKMFVKTGALVTMLLLLTVTLIGCNLQATNGQSQDSLIENEDNNTLDSISQNDMTLIGELQALDYETLTVEEYTSLFAEQNEKSDTFYSSAISLGEEAWYEENGDAHTFYSSLFLSIADYNEAIRGNENAVYDNYFKEFGDFDAGEQGAVAISIGWIMEINVLNRGEITVGERDSIVISFRNSLKSELNNLEKNYWLAGDIEEQVQNLIDTISAQNSTSGVSISVINLDLSVHTNSENPLGLLPELPDPENSELTEYTLAAQDVTIVEMGALDEHKDGAIVAYSFTDLEPGYLAINDTIYEVSNDQFVFSINWSPMGCPIGVGLQSMEDSTLYLATLESGRGSGLISTSSIPAGKYKVVVYSVAENEMTLAGTLAFNW